MSDLQLDRQEFARLLKASGNNLKRIRVQELKPEVTGPSEFVCKLALWHPFGLLGISWALLTYWGQ
jgi:hypothetical protein